jgi:NADH-quinone oxidoreductase subunit L
MTALAIAGPLAAAVLIVVLRRGAAALALLGAGVGSLGAVVSLTGVAAGARYAAELPGLPGLPLRLVAEPLTAALATVVAVVSALVLLYAVGYVGEERDKARFYAGMSFFSAAMQTLVLAGDWVVLLASWELIGLSSYLLIGFWYAREGVPQAATRAFLYTRTADLGLYVGIFVLITQTGTSEISATLEVGGAAAILASLLLLVAAVGKSAQAPLQGWLQDAMVGPTPVSALLHSATLVAAGAILMIRVSPLLPQEVLLAVGLVGGLTALVAALIHLVAHAAIKSSLFLGSGVFQHARGSTEFTELEGVGRARRWTFLGFAVAGLALAGVPPLSGFFSKDAILAASLESPYAPVLAPLAFAGTLLTATYIALALRLLWRGDDRTEPVAGIGWMGAGLAALVGLAATLGPALPPLARFVGAGLQEGIGLGAVSGALLALCGLALGWFVPAGRLLGPLRRPAEMGFRIDGGFDGLVARPALATARGFDLFDRGIHAAVLGIGRAGLVAAHASRLVDERSIDGLIGALVRGTRELGGRARKLQSGLVHRELLIAVAGVALIFALLVIGP